MHLLNEMMTVIGWWFTGAVVVACWWVLLKRG